MREFNGYYFLRRAFFGVIATASLTSGCDGLLNSSKNSKGATASSGAGIGLKAAMSSGLGPQQTTNQHHGLRSALKEAYRVYGEESAQMPSAEICQSINHCQSDFDVRPDGNSADSLTCSQTCLESSSKPVFSCSVRANIEQTCSNNVSYTLHQGSSFTMSNNCNLVGGDAEIHSKGNYQVILSASDNSFNKSKLTCSWDIAQKIDFQSANSSPDSSGDPFAACKGIQCSLDGAPLSCEEMQSVLNNEEISCESKSNASADSKSSQGENNPSDRSTSEEPHDPVTSGNNERSRKPIANTPEYCGGRSCSTGEYCLSSSYQSEGEDNVVYSTECRKLPLPNGELNCNNACECAHKDALQNVFPIAESTNCRGGHRCQNINGKVALECLIGL